MSYELGSIYFYNNQPVKLNGVWMENGIVYGACSPTVGYIKHVVVKVEQLTKVAVVTKRLNLTIKLLDNNDIQLEFVNYQVPEEQKELYTQTTIEVKVENHAKV
jgi:hypothetical protein